MGKPFHAHSHPDPEPLLMRRHSTTSSRSGWSGSGSSGSGSSYTDYTESTYNDDDRTATGSTAPSSQADLEQGTNTDGTRSQSGSETGTDDTSTHASGSETDSGSEVSVDEEHTFKGMTKKVVHCMGCVITRKVLEMLCMALVASTVTAGVGVGSYFGGYNDGQNSVECGVAKNRSSGIVMLGQQYCSTDADCDHGRKCVLTQCITSSAPFSVRLVWNNLADMDVYVTDPNGCTTYYKERTSLCSSFPGYLEYDCISCPLPQQEYTYIAQPVPGKYMVSVSLFDDNMLPYPIPYDIYITIKGVETHYPGAFTAETPNSWNSTRLLGCAVCPAISYPVTYE